MIESQSQAADVDFTHLLDFILRRRWIVFSIWFMVMIATVLVTYRTQPVYQAGALLEIEKARGKGGSYGTDTMVESNNEDYYQTQYKLLQSKSVAQKVYDALHLEKQADFSEPHGVQKLQGAISVAPVPRSRLAYVQAQSHDPKLAAQVANALSETFVADNLGNQLFISKNVLEALQANQSDPNARRTYDSMPAVVNNHLIQSLKEDYAKLESQYAEMSQKFTPKYPGMMALKANMEAIQRQLVVETDRVVQSLKTELSGQLQGNNVRIIDPAMVPEAPIKPNKSRNYMMGFLGGLILGIVTGYIVELLDQSIRTQEDVEKKLNAPYLGTIPLVLLKSDEPVYQNLTVAEPSLTSESFRNMRTMVDFAGVGNKADVLMVSSAVQEEGKSYVASNVAVVFAQLGERVLLIDGDLRRPQLHRNFRLSSKQGLSNFLATGNKVDEIGELLQDTGIPNLKLLACGPRPPNPSELLNTPRLGALMAWARAEFDRVIVDCTPLFPINDTLLWGRHAPSAVFVTRYGKTRTPIVQHACQKLQTGGVKLLGVVINAAKPSSLAYASYGYYYHQYYHRYYRQEAETAQT